MLYPCYCAVIQPTTIKNETKKNIQNVNSGKTKCNWGGGIKLCNKKNINNIKNKIKTNFQISNDKNGTKNLIQINIT